MNNESTIMARRAIEALRAGVPNRDAARQLPVFQGDIDQRFTEYLAEIERGQADYVAPRSMVISGAFGSGKSHVLAYLRHKAIESNFVCSRIVISKETPLFDPLKLIRAAAETASIPEAHGRAVPEVLFAHRFNANKFEALCDWALAQPVAADRIAALLKLVEERPAGGEQFLDDIAWEWSGYPMNISAIRNAIKEIGRHGEYHITTLPLRILGVFLWQFLPKLFQAAGYNGWVILVDEVELMLRYTKLQRAKAYASIARLAGHAKDCQISSFLPVFAVTDDFWANAEDVRHDSELGPWLRQRGREGDAELAKNAEAGMKILKHKMPLRSAKSNEFAELKERIRNLHSIAFNWEAPVIAEREVLASSSVREHIKSWITRWDMMLLYNDYRPEIVVERVSTDYSEDSELSKEDKDTTDFRN